MTQRSSRMGASYGPVVPGSPLFRPALLVMHSVRFGEGGGGAAEGWAGPLACARGRHQREDTPGPGQRRGRYVPRAGRCAGSGLSRRVQAEG